MTFHGGFMDPQQGSSQQDLLIGQTIGNYLVTQKLGEGGMGAVYLAEHPGIGKKVALKVLHNEFSTNQEVAARFFNEAKAVNDIGHPNIVDIHDFGIIQGGVGREQMVYFIMEYLAGLSLSGLIRNEAPLPPERALGIGLQVADALAASHKCGIVHRDLKPDNIMLIRRHRETDFVKLLDFGIAKLTGDVAGSRRTRTGIVMGTPAYMSPEQCEGRGNIDHRTDIYALGIVLYEMMTGRVPFIGEGYGEILVQHLTQMPLPPSQFHMMNAHVEAVLMKALEKRPDLRYPTMDEMMRAMADPVGYVEAHGGISGFAQRQLMPSSAPLPPIRMTPAPTAGMTATTPVPGHLTPYGLHSPIPNTQTGAMGMGPHSGILPPKKSKWPLVAAAVVFVGAVAAITFVVTKKNKGSSNEVTEGSGSANGVASSVTPGSDKTVEHGSGSAAVVATGSGSAETQEGSGSAKVEPPPPPPKTTAKLTFKTKPLGAEILVNGKALPDVITPMAFEFRISDDPVKITLRKNGFEDIVLENFVVTDDVTQQLPDFKRKRSSGTSSNSGKGSAGKGSAGKGSTKGSGTRNDTGLMTPD
jgi:serine/threonine protein kinase